MAEIIEEIKVLLILEGMQCEINMYLLQNLLFSCILAVDFWCDFGISLDFAFSGWQSRSWERRTFERISDRLEYACCKFSELITEQGLRLEKFVADRIPNTVADPGVTSLAEHQCYLVSPKIQEAIRRKVDKMLTTGIIEASFSEWSNPLVIVKKPIGKYSLLFGFP